jgi:hypothetical protein
VEYWVLTSGPTALCRLKSKKSRTNSWGVEEDMVFTETLYLPENRYYPHKNQHSSIPLIEK